jgi:L-amino acid N-acyltransferase YncA/8-oxo-dGTP pyrophosphatase MutT (NUDIX family)
MMRGKSTSPVFCLETDSAALYTEVMSGKYTFREVSENDAESLLEIYAPYVLNTAITFEYDVPSAEEFRTRIRTVLQKFPYIAAVNENGIIDGYAYASAFHPRKAYEHCAELSIYLRGNCRGHGLGTELYTRIEQRLASQGILNEYACIGTTTHADDPYLTDASPRFHEHLGFHTAGRFSQCGYKFGRWYDMIWMEKSLRQSPAAGLQQNSGNTERELWDIYDVNRQFTGRTMVRGSKNRPGDYHIVVHVCIFDKDGNMLIQQRAHDKRGWPDKWDFSIGGHVVSGETSRQGAERELREELGEHISLDEAPYLTIMFSDGFDDYYLVEKDIPLPEITLQKEEVQRVKYASKDEIKKMIADGSFIDYHDGLADLLYAMKSCRGAHASSGTREAQKA